MRCNTGKLALVCGIIVFQACRAQAALVYADDFEAETIGLNPLTPTIGANWFNNGNLSSNTVQANPLANAQNSSTRALQSERAGTPAGYSWIDLTPAESAQLAAGEKLTIQYQHYWPDAAKGGVFLGAYDNASHSFTNNAIDLELRAGLNRRFEYYNSATGYVNSGLSGTDNWDSITIVADFAANSWTLSVNGSSTAALPFTDNNDMSSVQTIMFGGSSGQTLAYVDNVRVYVGELPEPGAMCLLGSGVLAMFWFRRQFRSA
ncbi:MAG: PEP-CTERM sorting domain-containing protein [Pirellulales bacterium]|nr:PEP-CTERM sorting domain-containing protein [Pirellulales bacterium]